MPSKKLSKRIKETNKSFEESVIQNTSVKNLQQADDSALFTIDRLGSKAGRRRAQQEYLPKEEGTYISKTEKKLIEKIISTKGDSSNQKLPYGNEIVTIARDKIEAQLGDLWDEPRTDISQKKRKIASDSLKAKKAKIALPGQSYNPSEQAHQDILAEALAVEIKRQERLDALKALDQEIPTSVKDITQLFLADGSNLPEDLEFEDNDEDDDEVDEDGNKIRRKTPKALTKAQKNKRRAQKQSDYKLNQEKIQEKIIKSIDRLDNIVKEVEQENRKLEVQQQIRKKMKEEKKIAPVLSEKEVNTIPLTDELHGSLRQIQPKGIATINRQQEMLSNGDLFSNQRRTRRKSEKPHGYRKIVWTPKYKVDPSLIHTS